MSPAAVCGRMEINMEKDLLEIIKNSGIEELKSIKSLNLMDGSYLRQSGVEQNKV